MLPISPAPTPIHPCPTLCKQAVIYAFENFVRRFAHQFPTSPTAQVCLGVMLRRRACHDGTRPVPQALRRQIEQVRAGWVYVCASGGWGGDALA